MRGDDLTATLKAALIANDRDAIVALLEVLINRCGIETAPTTPVEGRRWVEQKLERIRRIRNAIRDGVATEGCGDPECAECNPALNLVPPVPPPTVTRYRVAFPGGGVLELDFAPVWSQLPGGRFHLGPAVNE